MSQPGAAAQVAASPASGTTTAAPVDLAHLERVTFGDRDLEREVLQLFAAQIPARLEILRTAHTVRDWRDAAHTLKGSARAIGAWRVARGAERLEELAGAQEQPDAMEHLERALDEAKRFIHMLLAQG